MTRTARLLLSCTAVLLIGAPLQAQSPTLLRLRNPVSAERLVVDSAGGMVVHGWVNGGSIPATGAGARMMWYPGRAAFRAGYVTGAEWDHAAVGLYSAAFGYGTTASGHSSTAMGLGSTASGLYSTAMGVGTESSGDYAVAMGRTVSASGDYAFAAGREAEAVGLYAIALGYGVTAGDESATAIGHFTSATGRYSTALGYATSASGLSSVATGQQTVASGNLATAMGGETTASGQASTAMGRSTTASGAYSTAMGDLTTASGHYSTAMGSRASTDGFEGAFVYGDASSGTTVMNATANHQFSVRAAGGVRLFSHYALGSGVTLAPGASSWNVVSDRARKEHFLAVDGEDVLARVRTLPISTWRYIVEEDRTVRHIGPMAQDWHAAFGFSSDSLTINSGDLDGVNLAGVQALDRRDRRQQAEIGSLRSEVAALREENAAFRARLDDVERMEERLRRVEHALQPTATPRR